MIKELLKKTFLIRLWNGYNRLKNLYVNRYIIPSYEQKRSILLHYRNLENITVFIETGTFLGDTIHTFRNDFETLVSFELSSELASKATKRFEDYSHIQIITGDSGELLPNVLKKFSKPCLFWLDGHYSSEFFIGAEFIKTAKGKKDTPIIEELTAILHHPIKKHVILIDDARCFNGENDYPTISEIKKFVKSIRPECQIGVKRDIIRITF